MELSRANNVAGDLNVALPDVPDEGVLIKTLYASVCCINSKRTPGYEVCGKVLSIGSSVPSHCSIKEGDVVIVYPWHGCMQCELCTSGSSHLCEENLKPAGVCSINSFMAISHWHYAIKLPKEIPVEIGCMLPCSALKMYAAILEAKPCFEHAVRLRGFANLLVIGCAGLELWCIFLLKSVFCDKTVKVVCAENNQERLDEACKLGADDAVLWTDDISVEHLVEATTMSGYNKMDVVIDLMATTTSFSVACLCLHNGGTLLEVGVEGEKVSLSLTDIVNKSLTIKTIRGGSILLLKQLIDLIGVQLISVVFQVEYYQMKDLELAIQKFCYDSRHGYVIVKCD